MGKNEKLSNTYNGNLTDKQIAEGINACKKNGRQLVSDAQILYDHKRYSSAIALAILAIEEFGKEPILRKFAGIAAGDSTSKLWNQLRSHKDKNSHWKITDFLKEGLAKGVEELFDLTEDPNSNETDKLDALKQNSFYSRFTPRNGWEVPNASKADAQRMIEIAENSGGLLPEVTEEQITELRALLNGPDLSRETMKVFTDKWGHKDVPL
ncbi:MAG: hypothetical protein QG574_1460 [Cyanobacteriota bacterium erpe_2018_sw_21hr_WHONDRS-SW48-000092_B_bin.40]|jgi:AbiV family abortive infection protein|nr:hypothetical protein [Cyanobacteriota bacterium erpe_2018_sw_21hr_WHONDRS-SW48-000092_B_bin.40]